MRRLVDDPLVAENAALAAVGGIYALRGAYAPAVALVMSSVASAAYHRSRETSTLVLAVDFLSSSASFAITLPYLARCPPRVQSAVLVIIVASFGAYGLAQEDGNYDVNHLLWHRLVTAGQFIVATGYHDRGREARG